MPILQSYLTGDFVRTDAYYIQPAFRIDPPSTNTPSPGTFTTNALADFSREMVQALRQPLIPRAQPSLPHPQSNTLFHAPAVPAQARWETASHADSDIDSEVEEDGTSREEWRMIDEDLKEATTDSCLISNAQTLWSRDRKHVQSEYKAIDRLAAGLYEHLNNDRPQKN
ncbi:MAG: hypothetical protein A3J38_08635 [Gammaproteobacteria bacterium RIFCSPHIGHO2_12_FULL_45_9]|nr:MAG: hypothetical protein A3J38_08635 [Gammaproteobacteria bacterium RIFCSPHIGHO2_12_FULL_45_9]